MYISGVGRILVRGDTWPPKGYPAPPAGVRLAAAPRMVGKFKILKRFKVLENESIFKNVIIFVYRKIIFSKKTFLKIEHILQKFVNFGKIYSTNFNFYGVPCKSREISNEFYYLVKKSIKNSKLA